MKNQKKTKGAMMRPKERRSKNQSGKGTQAEIILLKSDGKTVKLKEATIKRITHGCKIHAKGFNNEGQETHATGFLVIEHRDQNGPDVFPNHPMLRI